MSEDEYRMPDEEFREYLQTLRGLTEATNQWGSVKARKSHEDVFGDNISRGEHYLRRGVGVGFDEVVRVSKRNMELIFSACTSSKPFGQRAV